MERVRQNTSQKINAKIDEKIVANIQLYSSRNRDEIKKRIDELSKEWDTERVLEVNMPLVALSGLALGVWKDRRWFVFPTVVLGFFLQHAIQGWCPPLPIFRRLGYRTKDEIAKEKFALKYLRGDFTNLDEHSRGN